MKKLLIGLIAIVAVLVVGVLGAGALLPADYEVRRTKLIEKDTEQVQALLANLETWPEWTAWTKQRDPDCQWTFEGAGGAVGHTMMWDGPELGKGKLTLTKVEAMRVEYDLWFRNFDEAAGSKGVFELEDKGEGTTQVTWIDAGPLDYPVGRLFGPMFDKMLGTDFETGLEGLGKASTPSNAGTPADGADDSTHGEDLADGAGDESK